MCLSTKNQVSVSSALYALKAIAIIFVAAAHCTYTDTNIQVFTDILGTIGVPIFLIVSGVFSKNEYKFKDFVIGKIKRIVIPWIIWGIATYVLSIIGGGNNSFQLKGVLLWIIGYKTWLYFVPVLLICLFVFKICSSRPFVIIVIVVSCLSWLLTVNKLLDGMPFTSCQNPLNWMGFFGFGIILRERGILEYRPFKLIGKLILLSVCFVAIMLGYFIYAKQIMLTPSYWNVFSIPFELFSVATFWHWAFIAGKIRLLVDLGKNSYPLFFAHMQIGINLINLVSFNKINSFTGVLGAIALIIRPIAVIFISYLIFVVISKKVLKLMRLDRIKWVIGL